MLVCVGCMCMVYGVCMWCVVCGVWCVVCGVWCVVWVCVCGCLAGGGVRPLRSNILRSALVATLNTYRGGALPGLKDRV
jgi:hypothetical protein